MRNERRYVGCVVFVAVIATLLLGMPNLAISKPLKVYVLAGQSNMQGHAEVSTLDAMAGSPKTAPILKEILGADGKPRVCKNVWISSIGCTGDRYSEVIEQTGKLTVGFGATPDRIGPEYTFGLYMEKELNEPILIIKTSWGGRSLHTDFRSPSAGLPKSNDSMLARWKERNLDPNEEEAKINENVGVFYHHMIQHVQSVLKDIKRVVPDYDPKDGYELAGFVWFQGWNDYCDGSVYPNSRQPGGYDEYTVLLEKFIRDVRKDLSAPNMPFVIGVMGVSGEKGEEQAEMKHFRLAQNKAVSPPDFQGNVVAVQTALCWDDELDPLQQRREKFNWTMDQENKKNPNLSRDEKEAAYKKGLEASFTPAELESLKGVSNGGYHYLGAAKIMAPIGKAFAEAMLNFKKAEK